MSADNGIYILISPIGVRPPEKPSLLALSWGVTTLPAPDPDTKEYRVVHCQSIEDICWDTQARKMSEEIQPMMLKERFGDAHVFGSEDVARNLAFEMARELVDEGVPLECGISEIHYDKPFPH